MKISELLANNHPTFSFEFFPPKSYSSTLELGINIGQLIKLSPSFVSVTYGAGGSTQDASFDLIDYIQNKIGLTTMAHYTCVNASKEKVEKDLKSLYERNIVNLMLLRGDPPKGATTFVNEIGDFHHASDLIELAAAHKKFSIGAASYPEKHPESPHIDEDILYLKQKTDKGAEFLVTQMFFDNKHFFSFVEKARKAGITAPIIPGIIPIVNYKQIKKFSDMCGTEIPVELIELLTPYQDNLEKTYQLGVDFAIKQCRELLDAGVPGLHFYTLNKSRAAVDIFSEIKK